MKKLFSSIPAYFAIMIILCSCSKQSVNDSIAPASTSITNVVNATITSDQEYQFTVNEAGEVSLAKQAKNYRISKTELDSKTGKMVYHYIAAVDFLGSEEVILANRKTIYTSSSNACNNNNDRRNLGNNISYHTTYTKILLQIR
ncbi:hypothetical protein BH20BAC1_BH20BAC1_17320 [soil metagenome]